MEGIGTPIGGLIFINFKGKGERKMEYRLHRSCGNCDVTLRGKNIIEAIEGNFGIIANEAGIGNAAGYSLISVDSQYKAGILGGQGGVEVSINATGMPLVSGATGPQTRSTVWIHAQPDDLPALYHHIIK